MHRILTTLAIGAALVGCAAAHGEAPDGQPKLTISVAEMFDCDGVEGELVVLLHPSWGGVLIAPQPFEGAEELGRIDGGTIHLSMPGKRMPEQQFPGSCDDPKATRLWGRGIAILLEGAEAKAGCGGLPFTEETVAIGSQQVGELMERIAMGRN